MTDGVVVTCYEVGENIKGSAWQFSTCGFIFPRVGGVIDAGKIAFLIYDFNIFPAKTGIFLFRQGIFNFILSQILP